MLCWLSLLLSCTPLLGLVANGDVETLWFKAQTNKISFLYINKIIAVNYSYSVLKYFYEFKRSETI